MNVDFTESELEIISELINSYLPDLKTEVHRARDSDYKDQLKEREKIVVELQRKLG